MLLSKLAILVVLIFTASVAIAQEDATDGGIPDLNPPPDDPDFGDNCALQRDELDHGFLCCCSDGAIFTSIQCNDQTGRCYSLDETTMEFVFDSSIVPSDFDCNATMMMECPIATTEAPSSAVTTPVSDTTDPPVTTTVTAPPATTTAAPTTATTEAPAATTTVTPDTAAATTTEAPTTTMPPIITTEPPDEEDESTSRSSSSSRSSSMRSSTNRSRSSTSRSSSRSSTSRSSSRSSTTGDSDSSNTNSSRSGTTTRGSRSDSTDTRSRSGTTRRCPTRVRDLTRDGCDLSCIGRDGDDCPICMENCTGSSDPECSCQEEQVCLRIGRNGRRECVDLPGIGDKCDGGLYDDQRDDADEEDSSRSRSRSRSRDDDDDGIDDEEENSSTKRRRRDRARRRVRGATSRRAVGIVRNAELQCRSGLVCTTLESGRKECQPENQDGPCVQASSDLDVECDEDGNFRALQCSETIDGTFSCRCVEPTTGNIIPNTQEDVPSLAEAPDCSALVFQDCIYDYGGNTYFTGHGERYVNAAQCTDCMCENGDFINCVSTTCTRLSADRRACFYLGTEYEDGESFEYNCNLCQCNNGNMHCTRRECDEGDSGYQCDMCDSLPIDPVCGPNGQTYPTMCHAMYCGYQIPFTVLSVPCSNLDICELYPCEGDELCVPRGGVTCLHPDGCDPDERRLCVDPDTLLCADESDETTELELCGTNGETYPSLCRLLQDTGNEGVAYAGSCDSEECSVGPVCGSDGVTYSNPCVLESQSADARIDYFGECETDPDASMDQLCTRVSMARRCIYDESNCRRMVRPREGCCALCGGVGFIAFDRQSLGEFSSIHLRTQTLDDIAELFVEEGVIISEVTDRCDLLILPSDGGNIEFMLEARGEEDQVFCFDATQAVVDFINDPPEGTALPEVLQFAGSAVAAPALGAPDGATDGAPDGAPPTTVAMTTLVVLLAACLTALMF